MIHSVRRHATEGEVIIITRKARNDSRYNIGTMHVVSYVNAEGAVTLESDDEDFYIGLSSYEVLDGVGLMKTKEQILREDPLTPGDIANALTRGKIRFIKKDHSVICESLLPDVYVSGRIRDLDQEAYSVSKGTAVTNSKYDPIKLPLLYPIGDGPIALDIPQRPKNYITKEEAKSMIDNALNKKMRDHQESEHKKSNRNPISLSLLKRERGIIVGGKK